ncbi:MAG: shikimate dehydrogenase [Usitatibacter sp.]
MDRYAVFGNPIAHSLSPAIHALFAKAEGETIDYRAIEIPAGRFMIFAQRFFDEGGRGANVTLPYKVNAFHWAGVRSARAELAGAANFLMKRGGNIEADNTDGAGLVADLTMNLGEDLRGKRLLLFGAGGAARGVIAPLLALEPRSLVVANRTAERARDLARQFAAHGAIESSALDGVPPGAFDIVINATSGGTRGEALSLPPQVFGPDTLAYDMAYGASARSFAAQAQARGARASDGLGMLVEQAAESYLLWRGKRPATRPVLEDLRARLA